MITNIIKRAPHYVRLGNTPLLTKTDNIASTREFNYYVGLLDGRVMLSANAGDDLHKFLTEVPIAGGHQVVELASNNFSKVLIDYDKSVGVLRNPVNFENLASNMVEKYNVSLHSIGDTDINNRMYRATVMFMDTDGKVDFASSNSHIPIFAISKALIKARFGEEVPAV